MKLCVYLWPVGVCVCVCLCVFVKFKFEPRAIFVHRLHGEKGLLGKPRRGLKQQLQTENRNKLVGRTETSASEE